MGAVIAHTILFFSTSLERFHLFRCISILVVQLVMWSFACDPHSGAFYEYIVINKFRALDERVRARARER